MTALIQAAARACDRIAPSWPLDRFIAVNPFWSRTERPFPEVAGQLRTTMFIGIGFVEVLGLLGLITGFLFS